MRGIVIAGTHSGCGKTTVTLGVMAALRKKGLTVQPFKTGPDFIDAGLHRLVADRLSRNLDQWMCGQAYVRDCFARHAAGADIAVVEGVMGMYDGDYSTASLARLLDLPVLLVVDGYGMAESAGAVVKGFVDFGLSIADCELNDGKPEIRNSKSAIRIAGVIFNRVASENHYARLKESVRDAAVLGYLPRELDFEIPHRHLGLATAEENPLAAGNIDKLAEAVLKHIDVDAIMANAGGGTDTGEKGMYCEAATVEKNGRAKIAVAYDEAFCFYYEDNLDLLRAAGAELVLFSPLRDHGLPRGVDAVYIGGGYPELHAETLSRNEPLRASVRAWSESGKPMYAECGGLMYLSRVIRDFENRSHGMAGVFPFETLMLKKPKLGYRQVALQQDCILGPAGATLRGHEFHYSEIADWEKRGSIYEVTDSRGRAVGTAGFSFKNTLASYIHVHFGSNRNIAGRFTEFIKGVSI